MTIVNNTTRESLATYCEKVYDDTSNISCSNGFKYAVYKNGNDVVLAFAGTDSPGDWISNKQMGFDDRLPDQYNEALKAYLAVKNNNPNANITITGHSLGGSLAQLVAATTGEKAVTFNSYGVKHLLPQLGLRTDVPYSNIENYNLSSDILNLANHGQGRENIGSNYIIYDNSSKNPVASHMNFDRLKTDNAIALEEWQKQNTGYIKALQALYKVGQFMFITCASTMPLLKLSSLLLNMQNLFSQASTVGPLIYDPILIDLDGDGKIGTTTLENGVYFDHQKDGFAENSAWVDENDGILAIDKNRDGAINDGGEIFGDNYIKSNGKKATSGFDALRDLDSNNDGIISADDEAFSQIKILKGDGTSIPNFGRNSLHNYAIKIAYM